SPLANLLAALAMIVPAFAVLYRLSASLPGLALDRQTAFADGWVATTGETETILILAFFTGLIGIVLGAPLSLMPQGSVFALLWELVAGWVQLMVSASILTTLYGHYIEKRPLL
ncbi:MAG: threonine dehydratase, partial [Gemmobacter sp.]|nr:threonine dehydratase [Gemmobacter sp.]